MIWPLPASPTLLLGHSSVQSLSCVRLFATPWTEHVRLPCPSPTPGVCSDSCPSSRWCHPTISFPVAPFSSCPQSFPASRSFLMSQFFLTSGQSIGASASASALLVNIQDWFPSGLTGLILQSLKSLLQHHSSKASILWCSAFFMLGHTHLQIYTSKSVPQTHPWSSLQSSELWSAPRAHCCLVSSPGHVLYLLGVPCQSAAKPSHLDDCCSLFGFQRGCHFCQEIFPGPLSSGWKVKSCSVMSDWLFATPWTIQSMEFSRPEYWSG